MPTLPDLPQWVERRDGLPIRVLMVCMGNICRSPTAHGGTTKKGAGCACPESA